MGTLRDVTITILKKHHLPEDTKQSYISCSIAEEIKEQFRLSKVTERNELIRKNLGSDIVNGILLRHGILKNAPYYAIPEDVKIEIQDVLNNNLIDPSDPIDQNNGKQIINRFEIMEIN